MRVLREDVSGNAATINSRLDVLSERAKMMNLEFVEPEGAMYLFAKIHDGRDGTDLANIALKEGLAVAPGRGFGDYKEFIRISACRDEKAIKEGMNILDRVMRDR